MNAFIARQLRRFAHWFSPIPLKMTWTMEDRAVLASLREMQQTMKSTILRARESQKTEPRHEAIA